MSAMRFNLLHKHEDAAADEGVRPAAEARNDNVPPEDNVTDDNMRNGNVRDARYRNGDLRDDEGDTRPVGRNTADPAPARREAVASPTPDVVTEKRRIAPRAPQIGSGLCGFLAAVGGYVVIAALVHAVVAKAGTGHRIATALDGARLTQPAGVSWSGAIALLVLAFVVCLIGGYVCGTMARRSGMIAGLAVWLWAAVAAVVASLIVEFASSKYAVLYQFDLFPRIHVGSFTGMTGAVISAIILAAAGLIGALLGGTTGAVAHRRVHVVETDSRSRW